MPTSPTMGSTTSHVFMVSALVPRRSAPANADLGQADPCGQAPLQQAEHATMSSAVDSAQWRLIIQQLGPTDIFFPLPTQHRRQTLDTTVRAE